MVAIDGSCVSGQAKSSALIRAQEVRSNLEPEFPSFVKSLVRSHVASCFWMVSAVRVDKNMMLPVSDTRGKYMFQHCCWYDRGFPGSSASHIYQIKILR